MFKILLTSTSVYIKDARFEIVKPDYLKESNECRAHERRYLMLVIFACSMPVSLSLHVLAFLIFEMLPQVAFEYPSYQILFVTGLNFVFILVKLFKTVIN